VALQSLLSETSRKGEVATRDTTTQLNEYRKKRGERRTEGTKGMEGRGRRVEKGGRRGGRRSEAKN